MHHFSWYFIKGEKIRISSFNWYLVYLWFPLPYFMMKNDWKMNIDFILVSYAQNEKYLQLVSRCLFVYFHWYQERIGNQDYLYIFHFGIKIWLVSLRIVFNASFTFNWHLLKCLLMCSLSIGMFYLFYWYHDEENNKNNEIDIFFSYNWYHKMFWFVLPICKGSLTSLLHIDSCWVYLILRSLTTLLYAIHVCRGSFTSPLMHCILCVMWIRACHPFFM